MRRQNQTVSGRLGRVGMLIGLVVLATGAVGCDEEMLAAFQQGMELGQSLVASLEESGSGAGIYDSGYACDDWSCIEDEGSWDDYDWDDDWMLY